MKKKDKVSRQIIHLFATSLCLCVISSCSIKYDSEFSPDETNPELTFTQATLYKIEEGNLKMQLNSTLIEQYKNDNSYAENAEFFTWDNNNELDTTGSCQIMGIDQRNEIYTLLNDIEINSNSNNLEIKTDALRWNGKNQQLTSNRESDVYIKHDDMVITGKGFSASGISKSYSFSSAVTGEMNSGSNNEEAPEENSGE